MTALDNNALIAAFQLNPPVGVAVYRARVRHFIAARGGVFMAPAVALSEYLFRFDPQDRRQEFDELLRRHVFVAGFDQLAAEVAADRGRRYAAGRPLSAVARDLGGDRVCLKADLLIVATAVRHSASGSATNDAGTHAVARFAGLDSHLLTELPDPPPVTRLPTDRPASTQLDLFNSGGVEPPGDPPPAG